MQCCHRTRQSSLLLQITEMFIDEGHVSIAILFPTTQHCCVVICGTFRCAIVCESRKA